MRFIFAIAAVLFFATPAFAQKACTQIGCNNGLTFTADPEFDWPGGIYEIFVIADGNSMACKGTLPLKDCRDGIEPSFRCNSKNIRIGESGCMLPSPQHAISDIWVNGSPRKVNIRVTRNGKPYITRSIAPEYKVTQPNGPGCGPVCKSANYNLLSAD